MKLEEVTMIPVPRYKELGVKPVWEMIKEVSNLLSYFPDFQANEMPDRTFMWSVVSTLRPDACKELLEKARKVRSLDSEENNDELIEIHPDFMDKLLDIQNLSKSTIIINLFAWFNYRQRKSCILAKTIKTIKNQKKKSRNNIKQTWVYLKKKRERRNRRSNQYVKSTCPVGRGLTTWMWTWEKIKEFLAHPNMTTTPRQLTKYQR